MGVLRVGSTTDGLLQSSQTRLEVRVSEKSQTAAPASSLAVPTETARAEVNSAALMTAMMMPTQDGIFSIGSVAVKIGSAIKSVTKASWSYWGFGFFFAVVTTTTGCLTAVPVGPPTDIVEAGNATVIVDTPADLDASQVVCNPFTNTSHPAAGLDHGIVANLTYLDDTQPRYGSALDYQIFGHPVDATLFFDALDVPTRAFDRGFVNQDGHTFVNDKGNTLYEYFSMRFETVVTLSNSNQPGKYQFGVLADDGAVVEIDRGNGWETLINDDGVHPTRFGCATSPVSFDWPTRLPVRVTYYQGPRYHIALVLLWREWKDYDLAWSSNDPQCNQQGNSRFFDSAQTPSTPKQAYIDMLTRGWRPLSPANYRLPSVIAENPCRNASSLTTQIDSVDPTGSVTNHSSVTFGFSSNNSLATFLCNVDAGAAADCGSPKTVSGLTDGTHTFFVRAKVGADVDPAGASHTWSQDTVPPNLVLSSSSSTSSSFTIDWTTTEPASAKFSWGPGSSTANLIPDDGVYSTTHSVTITGVDPDSIYSYVISGRDLAGNSFNIARRIVITQP